MTDPGALSTEELDAVIAELEQTAYQLRQGELPPEGAAAAVERCAELAAKVATRLEALAREPEDQLPGQEQLPSG